MHAVVRSEHVPLHVDDLAARPLDPVPFEKLPQRRGANEADLHALRLVGVGKSALTRDAAHLHLGQRAERELHHRQLLLRQAVEEVALVLRRVGRSHQPEAAVEYSRMATPAQASPPRRSAASAAATEESTPPDMAIIEITAARL